MWKRTQLCLILGVLLANLRHSGVVFNWKEEISTMAWFSFLSLWTKVYAHLTSMCGQSLYQSKTFNWKKFNNVFLYQSMCRVKEEDLTIQKQTAWGSQCYLWSEQLRRRFGVYWIMWELGGGNCSKIGLGHCLTHHVKTERQLGYKYPILSLLPPCGLLLEPLIGWIHAAVSG